MDETGTMTVYNKFGDTSYGLEKRLQIDHGMLGMLGLEN